MHSSRCCIKRSPHKHRQPWKIQVWWSRAWWRRYLEPDKRIGAGFREMRRGIIQVSDAGRRGEAGNCCPSIRLGIVQPMPFKGSHRKGYVPQCTHSCRLLSSSLCFHSQDSGVWVQKLHAHHFMHLKFKICAQRRQQRRRSEVINSSFRLCAVQWEQWGWMEVGGGHRKAHPFFIAAAFPSTLSLHHLYGTWITCVLVGEGLLGSTRQL